MQINPVRDDFKMGADTKGCTLSLFIRKTILDFRDKVKRQDLTSLWDVRRFGFHTRQES